MNCFSIFDKSIIQRCFPRKDLAITPLNQATLTLEEEQSPQPTKFEPMPESVIPIQISQKRQEDDSSLLDNMLKNIEPKYSAPKKVNFIVLTKDVDRNGERRPESKSRFDLEEDEFKDLGDEPEDLKLG
ncbi:unnamed protein product [Blepharisma stoltei]|uniref:Uncharacterized protein n=1 Tax=Blepharisma stoltei TaxID=1481888 RepID=A0AAU9JSK2_9CILI|nr:unnamed protein product [Blepharisma stoltei]